MKTIPIVRGRWSRQVLQGGGIDRDRRQLVHVKVVQKALRGRADRLHDEDRSKHPCRGQTDEAPFPNALHIQTPLFQIFLRFDLSFSIYPRTGRSELSE